jgi:hypothetical protein
MSVAPVPCNPMHLVELGAEIDSLTQTHMKNSNKVFAQFGLSFDQPPTEAFRRIAQHRSGIALCRFFNTIQLMRISWLDTIFRHLNRLINRSDQNLAAKQAWIELQKETERISQIAADLILSTIPFYLNPDPNDRNSQLNSMSIYPLLWPLQCFQMWNTIKTTQREKAKEALFQIGARANIPMVTRIAERFHSKAGNFEAGHMLHLS